MWAHGQTEIMYSIKLYVNMITKGRKWMWPIRKHSLSICLKETMENCQKVSVRDTLSARILNLYEECKNVKSEIALHSHLLK